MERYTRTKDGIYEPDGESFDELDFLVKVKGGWNYLPKKEPILKEADTIEELCDKFIGVEENGTPHIFAHECDLSDLIRNTERKLGTKVTGYGAIWTTGEDGEPILESVAKMNEKGEMELL